MGPSHFFQRRRRRGVSELYASLLMVGVTLTLGGAVVSAALGQFTQAEDSASVGASVQQASAEVRVGLVYLVAPSSGSCPTYGGYGEGTAVTIALYNYGVLAFTPSEIFLNGTGYGGGFSPLPAGSMEAYALSLGGCAHPQGETVVITDSRGDEVQFAT